MEDALGIMLALILLLIMYEFMQEDVMQIMHANISKQATKYQLARIAAALLRLVIKWEEQLPSETAHVPAKVPVLSPPETCQSGIVLVRRTMPVCIFPITLQLAP